MFKLFFIESFKNINKNRVLTFLMIALLIAMFVLEGFTLSYILTDTIYSRESNNETLINYDVYSFGSQYNTRMLITIDPDLYSNDIPYIKSRNEFYGKLDEVEHLIYNVAHTYFIPIQNFASDSPRFISRFTSENSAEEDVTCCLALQTSTNFYKTENYRIIEGRDYTAEDMIYSEGKPVPVLLGYGYKGVYSPGDILEISSDYISSSRGFITFSDKLEVIGILAEDTEIIYGNGTALADLDSYIVIPYICMPTELLEAPGNEDLAENAACSLQVQFLNTKLMVDPEYKEETINGIQTALNGFSRFSKYFSLRNYAQTAQLLFAEVKSRASFYSLVTAVLMFFSAAAIVIAVINRVSRNIRDYAVHITVGATRGNTVGFTVFETFILLLFSALMSLMIIPRILKRLNIPFDIPLTLALFAVSSLLILAVSAAAARFALSKYDICSLVK